MPRFPSTSNTPSPTERTGTPLVSIIILLQKSAARLEDTLESVLQQSWPATELFAVSESDRDGPFTNASTYRERIRLIQSPRGDRFAARNAALRASQGEYVCFLEANDVFDSRFVESMMARLEEAGFDDRTFAFGAGALFEDELQTPPVVFSETSRDLDQRDLFVELATQRLRSATHGFLLPLPLVHDAGGWDENLTSHHETAFLLEIVTRAKAALFCKDARYFCRHSPNNSSGERSDRSSLESLTGVNLRILEQICLRLPRTSRFEEAYQGIARELHQNFERVYLRAPDLAKEVEARIEELTGFRWQLASSPALRVAARVLGTKNALRIRHWCSGRRRHV